MEKKFNGGQIVTTTTIANTLSELTMRVILDRHFSGDWGATNMDKEINDEAIEFEGDISKQDRVLSVYEVIDIDGKMVTVWIITEYDRSVTTILYPDED